MHIKVEGICMQKEVIKLRQSMITIRLLNLILMMQEYISEEDMHILAEIKINLQLMISIDQLNLILMTLMLTVIEGVATMT